MLVADNLPLQRLIDQLGEYRSGYLGLDPSLAGLRISGSFPLHDSDKALAALALSLPVRTERLALVDPRGAGGKIIFFRPCHFSFPLRQKGIEIH